MDLQAALDMKYSKEGEVAILRKGVEKACIRSQFRLGRNMLHEI